MKKLITLLLLIIPHLLWAANYTVSEVDGQVFARAKGSLKKFPVTKNQELKEYTRINLSEGAYLLLVTPMKDDIELSGKTYLKLGQLNEDASGKTTCKLELYKGISRTKVHKLSPNSTFTIKTPVAVAGVRGTEFQTSVSESGETEIAVLEGEVAVSDPDSSAPAISVSAGRKAKLKGDGKVTVKTVANLKKKEAQKRASVSKKAAVKENKSNSTENSNSNNETESDESSSEEPTEPEENQEEENEEEIETEDTSELLEEIIDTVQTEQELIIDQVQDEEQFNNFDLEIDLETIER